MMQDRDKKVSQDLTTAVNCFCDEKKVAQYLLREHRTLQQNLMRVFVEYVKLASGVGQSLYDDRNEASMRMAVELMQIPEAKAILERGLPMI